MTVCKVGIWNPSMNDIMMVTAVCQSFGKKSTQAYQGYNVTLELFAYNYVLFRHFKKLTIYYQILNKLN